MFSINPYINFGSDFPYLNYRTNYNVSKAEGNCENSNLPTKKYTTCKYDEYGNLIFMTFDANTGEILEKYIVKARMRNL